MDLQNDYNNFLRADTIIVLDFETTGLSPQMGDRAIEIGAVLLEEGKVKARFQELMNPGFRISSFIESYTGITNDMLEDAPPCSQVMDRFADFIGSYNLIAHNASFDKRFLDSEFRKIQRRYKGTFACSMRLSRRVYQDSPNHKLSTLVRYKNIRTDGVFHRALADSEMTARLWMHMLEDLERRYGLSDLPFEFIEKLSKKPKASVHRFLSNINNV